VSPTTSVAGSADPPGGQSHRRRNGPWRIQRERGDLSAQFAAPQQTCLAYIAEPRVPLSSPSHLRYTRPREIEHRAANLGGIEVAAGFCFLAGVQLLGAAPEGGAWVEVLGAGLGRC
jgi:hypothetical protein